MIDKTVCVSSLCVQGALEGVKLGGWIREKRLMRWVEAAMERVAATLFGGKSLQWYFRGLASSLSAVTEAQDKTISERSD